MPAITLDLPPELAEAIARRVVELIGDGNGRAEPAAWIDKRELACHLGCSIRWIEARLAEGMPSALIAGRRKFQAAEAEKWLERAGHFERQ